MPLPELPELPALELPTSQEATIGVCLGILCGAIGAHMAVKALFVEGLDDKERRGMLKVSAAGIAMLGLWYLAEIDRRWLKTEHLKYLVIGYESENKP